MSKKIEFICAFCCATTNIDESDLGHECFECPTCGSDNYIPETIEELKVQNADMKVRVADSMTATHYRVMLQGEDHVESCLKNNVPVEWAELVCTGYSVQYPDGTVYLEPEENYGSARRLLDYLRDNEE
jgi:hypothetical protein